MGSFDFKDYDKFIQLGYKAAKSHAEELRTLAKKLATHPRPRRNARLAYPTSMRFHKITTNGAEPIFEKMILNELRLLEDYAVDLDHIDEGLSELYGTKNFSKASYTFNPTSEGLELDIEVEEIAPFSLGFNANRFDLYNTCLLYTSDAADE